MTPDLGRLGLNLTFDLVTRAKLFVVLLLQVGICLVKLLDQVVHVDEVFEAEVISSLSLVFMEVVPHSEPLPLNPLLSIQIGTTLKN